MKSSGSPGPMLVAVPEDFGDRLGDRGRLGRHGGDRDVVDVLDALQLLLHGRVRREDRVVLILAETTLPLARHHADDVERLVADADDLPGRIDVRSEERIGHGRAQHGDLRCGVHVLRGEEVPVLHRPDADHREVDVGPLDAGGPVLVARDDLGAGVHAGSDVLHTGDLARARRRRPR
jgi:hypothetical protein